jgi:hypothetical protein
MMTHHPLALDKQIPYPGPIQVNDLFANRALLALDDPPVRLDQLLQAPSSSPFATAHLLGLFAEIVK